MKSYPLRESTVALGRKAKPRFVADITSKWVSANNFVITVQAEPLKRFGKPKTLKLYLSREDAASIFGMMANTGPE